MQAVEQLDELLLEAIARARADGTLPEKEYSVAGRTHRFETIADMMSARERYQALAASSRGFTRVPLVMRRRRGTGR